MQGRKDIQPKMMYQVNINDLVSDDNFYRNLSQTLNLTFLYSATAPYYGTEGQESIDPVVFFKICLVGYLNNINSDRRLISFCGNCLDVRWYLKYDIDEELPWHSTISRTRQLYGEEVFLSLFQKVLSICVQKGMVRGKRQAIDSAYIKANASMDSLQEKSVTNESELNQDLADYCQELNQNSEYKIQQQTEDITPKDKGSITVLRQKQKEVEQHHDWKKEAYKDMPGKGKSDAGREDEFGNIIRPKYLSNHTHTNPTDPDSRISVKPGKARQMNYYAQVAVDDSNHVITAAGADFADKRDSECLPHILSQNINNLKLNEITAEQILADTGFSGGTALAYCTANNIDAYIPNHGQYKYAREGFIPLDLALTNTTLQKALQEGFDINQFGKWLTPITHNGTPGHDLYNNYVDAFITKKYKSGSAMNFMIDEVVPHMQKLIAEAETTKKSIGYVADQWMKMLK